MADLQDPESAQVFVLLGASNLTLAWPNIVRLLERRVAAPRRIYTANGMGRSYLNQRSRLLLRQLPGILHSGIWDALEAENKEAVAHVLITDLGNDLVYGRSPEEVAQSAEESLRRVRARLPLARIVLTAPPLDAVQKLGMLRFLFFRTVIFPSCRLSLGDVKQGTSELKDRLREIADREEVPLYQPNPQHYTFDPIHVTPGSQQAAFGGMIDLWQAEHADNTPGRRHQRPLAEKRWVRGRERLTPQPSVHLNETQVFAF